MIRRLIPIRRDRTALLFQMPSDQLAHLRIGDPVR